MKNMDEISRNMELARAYVPFQIMNQVFNQKEALRRGTLFPELYKPYTPNCRDENGRRNYYE
ncbi:MAG: spore coat associated protein CotJA [Tissierellia bacterium]|nr:spore coat associated protein CotJA [Tissierellia bacterium]